MGQKKKRNNKKICNEGITLIALVITIIVLLILAGITINVLMGENGLITKAMQAAKEQKKAQYFEEINLEILDEQTERFIKAKDEPFIKSIQERIQEKTWVKNVIMCKDTGNGIEDETNPEKANVLIVETKDNYEIIIDVSNDELTAIIRDYFEKIGNNNKYTIKYDKNGGTGDNIEEQEIRKGFSIKLRDNTYIKENYEFVGWCENKEGEGEIYQPGSNYIPSKNTTLYAIWGQDVITITFESNVGSNSVTGEMEKVTIIKNTNTKLPANEYVREGYHFIGWNTKADGTGTTYEDEEMINIKEDITLYAQWKEKIIGTITFNEKKLTEGTNIKLGATALSSGIQKVELKIGNITVYTEEMGTGGQTSYTKELGVDNLTGIENLEFYNNYTATLKMTSIHNEMQEVSIENVQNFTIGTANSLKKLATLVDSNVTFKDETILQISDIDLNPGKWTTDANGITNFTNTATQWNPIGNAIYDYETNSDSDVKPFSGIYNGNNKIINGLYINNRTLHYGALFAQNDGTIKNIVLKNSLVKGLYNPGGIVGANLGKISYCRNYASINGKVCVGGICGWSVGEVEKCINYGKIEEYNDEKVESLFIGGIAGWVTGSINNCGNYGKVYVTTSYSEQQLAIGGVAGEGESLQISNCYNHGELTCTGKDENNMGGIIGVCNRYKQSSNRMQITRSYNKGNINGVELIGGILSWGQNVEIVDCYNLGNLTCGKRVGGITAWIDAGDKIENCYNIGNISIQEGYETGSLLGNYGDKPTLTNNYASSLSYKYAVGEVFSEGWNSKDGVGVQVCVPGIIKNLSKTLGSNWKADTKNINDGYPILNWQE